jgi:hypothetical protein
MPELKKPNVRGPAPSRKAHVALGEKLNRKAKDPPTFPGKRVPDNSPPAHRRSTKR